jgi:hypothetical protein
MEDGSESERLSLHDLVVRSADSGLSLQNDDGSFPAGENYAYGDPETPVRNTARWSIVLCGAYRISGGGRFRDAAEDAIDFLLGGDARPHGYTFHCRKTSDKDYCNGLVGQATPIRALTVASEVLGRSDALDTAREVFALHPFDDDLGLWERIEIDGENLSFDRTLNHQIIFAARCASLTAHDDTAVERITTFLDALDSNMAIHSDGLIRHYVHPPIRSVLAKALDRPETYPLLWNALVNPLYLLSKRRRRKELGYHPVNLSALARLHAEVDDHAFWSSDTFDATIRCLRERTEQMLSGEDIVHGSTMPGTDIAIVLHEFEGTPVDELRHLVERDLDRLLDRSSYLLDSSRIDSNDQAALVVSFFDLPDATLSIAPHG